jgi:DUF1680 family protein
MLTTHTPAAPVVPSTGRLRPLGIDEVRITGGFWADRQRTNAAVTLPHIAHWQESEGWMGNFDLAASGVLPEGRRGREFSDSEIYKFLEAVAWELGRCPDPELEELFRRRVARIAAAQEPDGYLNTNFGRPGQGARWSDLAMGHELYCLGHLFQAAVARARTAPGADDGLLRVARRAADLVCEVFADGGIESVCGHPEIELGLAELYRVTGERRYLRQASLFVDRRGHGTLPDVEWGRAYYQDDVPIRSATALRGHAVRANYLAAGAVDVAVETGDAGLAEALKGQWMHTIARRSYVTGGQGSRHQDEGYGEDWELPPDRAYAETCASIASGMFSWRLLLATGETGYADQIERVLYNGVAPAVSHTGDRFFYTNTLQLRAPGAVPDPGHASPRANSGLRAPWFEVTCCPPNIARTLASLTGLVATVDTQGLQLHQYASCSISTTLDDGSPVAVEVETAYPEDGRVRVRVASAASRRWRMSFRVPSWASSAVLTYRPVNGAMRVVRASEPTIGVAEVFAEGDELELELPVAAEFVRPDPRIDAVRGCVAVQRGPVVYCAQSVVGDAGIDLADLVVDPGVPPLVEDGAVIVRASRRGSDDAAWPYAATDARGGETAAGPYALIPYHDWGQDGPCTMRVWLPAS